MQQDAAAARATLQRFAMTAYVDAMTSELL
jgi:hypothetical protein